MFGSIELPRPEGEPRVFVISAGGSGIEVYRKLQKENIPFAAGILYPNDIDYQLARLLAAEVITEKPFCAMSEETYRRALTCMNACERVHLCRHRGRRYESSRFPAQGRSGESRKTDLL